MPEAPPTRFDWRIYADATCAGLTPLIPIPIVDLIFEATFRRRMPRAIARARNVRLKPADRVRLARRDGRWLTAAGCLSIPVVGARYLARRLWHKLVYVLAVADAASLTSGYWHRAYLMDHMIRAGHLGEGADSDWAIQVFSRTLREADTSPLTGLAREVIAGSHRVLRLLARARRRGSAAETESLAEIVGSHWGAARRSLEAIALRYNELYTQRPQNDGELNVAR